MIERFSKELEIMKNRTIKSILMIDKEHDESFYQENFDLLQLECIFNYLSIGFDTEQALAYTKAGLSIRNLAIILKKIK